MIKDILTKYGAVKNQYNCNINSTVGHKRYIELVEKWKQCVEKGWYGFDLGPVPYVWYDIIDESLDYVKSIDPNFKILQQKVKFGGYRCYLNTNCKINISEEINLLEETLFDEKLIY